MVTKLFRMPMLWIEHAMWVFGLVFGLAVYRRGLVAIGQDVRSDYVKYNSLWHLTLPISYVVWMSYRASNNLTT